MGLKIFKTVSSFVKETSSSATENALKLKELKENNIFSTFGNVWKHNNQERINNKFIKAYLRNLKKIQKGKTLNPKTLAEMRNIQMGIDPINNKNMVLTAALGCYINKDDIQNAQKELGTIAMLEEIAKTSIMFNLFIPAMKTSKNLVNTSVKTVSIYTSSQNASKGLSLVSTPLTLGTGFCFGASIKSAIDKCWETQYEKAKK